MHEEVAVRIKGELELLKMKVENISLKLQHLEVFDNPRKQLATELLATLDDAQRQFAALQKTLF